MMFSYDSVIFTRPEIPPFARSLSRHGGLLLLAAFALVGVWVLDDYGMSTDEGTQRNLAVQTLDYLLGDDDALPTNQNKFYGMAFEVPLLLLERALGLEDSRDVFLTRHLVTHMFFLAGGFFCYLLAYRLFQNRLLAVLAMLLFILHPRLYAHSFFNTKDMPFLSMFMICLYLTHRAFGDGNIWRFIALGVAVGVLINLRIMGLALFVAVTAMQLLDLLHADGSNGRRRVLASMAAFGLSTAMTVYVSMPYLWPDPIGRSMGWFATLSQHPTNVYQLFRGEMFRSGDFHPPEYVPVWFSITTAPITLALGMLGILAVLRGVADRFGDALRNTRLRFGLMLIGCFVLPVVAVIALSSNVYGGWRQMYFIYAPFCMLAAFGVQWTMSCVKGARLKPGMYGVFGAGLAAAVASMILLHPHQQIYFNLLADRTTPEHLRSQYEMDYWLVTLREGYEHLMELHPASSIYIETDSPTVSMLNRLILPAAERHRLFLHDDDADFRFHTYQYPEIDGTEIYFFKIYGSTTFTIRDMSLQRGVKVDDVLRDAYIASTSQEPAISSDWDVYMDDGTLVYVREPCAASDYAHFFFLHVNPADASDLPEERQEIGFDNLDFSFHRSGGVFDGTCLARAELPEYEIESISTGQYTPEGQVWNGEYSTADADVVAAARELRQKGVQPAIRSVFDVHIYEGRVVYAKSPCTYEDRETRFFLHVRPADVSDLPEERKESGFENLDFNLYERGGESDGDCFAVVDLPAYQIASISTGQYTADGQVWRAELEIREE